MMNHDQANELLAALALDAVEDDERTAIDEHVGGCPRCQNELDALREVAGALGNSVEPLPDGLWSGIAARIDSHAREVAPTAPQLSPRSAEATSLALAFSRRSRAWLSTAGAVAAGVIVVLAVSLSNTTNHVAQLQKAVRTATNNEVAAALEVTGHKVVELRAPNQQKLAQFVLLPDGRGYLVTSELPALGANQTYQLWGVIGGRAISLALMGSSPGHVTFTASGSPQPSVLGITVEPAGGSTTPTSSMVASSTV